MLALALATKWLTQKKPHAFLNSYECNLNGNILKPLSLKAAEVDGLAFMLRDTSLSKSRAKNSSDLAKNVANLWEEAGRK